MGADGYEFKALRPGETERTCAKCGKGFIPTARTQRYCAQCRDCFRPDTETKRNERERKRTLMRGCERKVDNNILGLNHALFRELDKIERCQTPEEIEAEAIRADKVCNLASNIIQNGKLMLSAAAMSVGVAESVNVPKMLLGNGDGK